MVEGFRFLGTRPNVRMTFLADIVAMATAFPRALLPAIGGVILGGGESAVGLLLAAMAARTERIHLGTGVIDLR